MSLRKSSSRRKGSKSDVLPKPNARRRCTPAPSSVGLDLIIRFTGPMEILYPPVPEYNRFDLSFQPPSESRGPERRGSSLLAGIPRRGYDARLLVSKKANFELLTTTKYSDKLICSGGLRPPCFQRSESAATTNACHYILSF